MDFLARTEGHRYGSHRCQRADLHLPSGPAPYPVAVTIHGGYWRARHGRRPMRAIAADLARRGHAVWNVEYRRIGRNQGGGWPATFEDVDAVIDALATLGDDRLDLSSVAAIGHSAGGQLALWAAARAAPAVPIRRVVGQGAVCDLAGAGPAARALIGGSFDDFPERYAAADPMRLLPLGIPVLLVHGAADETVPLSKSRRYAEAARAAGDPVELYEPVRGGHRSHLDPRSEAWRIAAEWVTRTGAGSAPRAPGG